MMPVAPRPNVRALAVPFAITLAVTLLRLCGELRGWPQWLCGSAAGGGLSLLGIGWLVPVFGVVFARRLVAAGALPRPRALLWLALGLVTMIAGMALAATVLGRTFFSMAVGSGCSVLGAWLGSRGWPLLAGWNLAYAISARVPIAVITALAIAGDWGTHYERLAPGSPDLAPLPRFLILVLAQGTFWLSITVLGGGICGTLATLRRRGAVVQ